jgi:small-conductance mechanosensitive channel
MWNKMQQNWEFELWVIDEKSVTIKKVVTALFILIIGMVLVGWIARYFIRHLLSRTRLDESATAAIERILYYLALLLLMLFVLRKVNIPLTAFTFLGGALVIGVGFGTQKLLNNFISGFVLMIERPVKIGDMIEIENNFGIIEDIGSRSTCIRTAGNVHILVPNSSFLEKNIVNWTLSDQEIQAKVTVGVVSKTNTRKVSQLMLKAALDHEKVLRTPEPFVLFSDFSDNALVFDVYFWISMRKSLMERSLIESDVRFRIDDLFRESDIVVANPQRDVHLDIAEPFNLRILKDEDETIKMKNKGYPEINRGPLFLKQSMKNERPSDVLNK